MSSRGKDVIQKSIGDLSATRKETEERLRLLTSQGGSMEDALLLRQKLRNVNKDLERLESRKFKVQVVMGPGVDEEIMNILVFDQLPTSQGLKLDDYILTSTETPFIEAIRDAEPGSVVDFRGQNVRILEREDFID